MPGGRALHWPPGAERLVFWTVAGPVIGVLGLIATAIIGSVRWFRGRQVLICELATAVPVLDRARLGPQATAPALTVSHKGRKLGNPYLVQIRRLSVAAQP